MELIDKSALVAEIKKLEKMYCYDNKTNSGLVAISVFENINNVINTLEMKEVDLEKHLKEDIEDILFDLNGVAVKGATHYLTVEDVKDIAKYFFELGLKTKQTTI